MPDRDARLGSLTFALLLLALLATAAFALLPLLGVPGPWSPLTLAAAALGLFAAAALYGMRATVSARESSRVAPEQRIAAERRDYAELMEEIERHKRLERELIAAKQAAEAAMMSKGEFLATMSHEIRTPLNGIVPLLDILLSSPLAPDQREYVQTAYQSARQLLRIVDDILDYSKLEANKLELETVGLNLRDLLDAVMRLMEKPAEAKGLRLRLRIDPTVRLAARGDPVRLRQVLTNLLSNAVKFTEKGAVSLSVTRKGETATHHEMRFEVRDSGIGIAPEAAAKLFQPFSQADASTTRTFGGTGLGLVICKRIVDLMGGRIGVQSEPGRGSLFWFEVPMLKALGDVSNRRRDLNGARALVVSADHALQRRFAIALPNWGVSQVFASTTQEALAKLRAPHGRSESWAFHLMIVDLQTIRTTALALHRNVLRESVLEDMRIVYLEGDESVPAEVADNPRALFLPRHAPDVELRQRIARFMQDEPVAASNAQPVVTLTPSRERPALRDPEQPSTAAAENAPVGGTVLLVEDNPVNRQVAHRLLTLAGVTIETAENGQQAIDLLAQRRFDAVLMDCQMPVMDGYSATRAWREREAAQSQPRIPIIAMTANAMVGDREKCLEAGMDDYLSKPLNRAKLEETLRRWIKPAVDAVAALQPELAVSNGAPTVGSGGRRRSDRIPTVHPVVAMSRPVGAAGGGAAPNEPALSQEIVGDLRDIMGAEFDALVRVFLEDAPLSLARLGAAARADDIDALVAPAHSLKSTSANLGALRLSDLAKEIEHGARKRTIDDATPLVRALEAEYDRAADELRRLIGG